jgi:hypothetical protein
MHADNQRAAAFVLLHEVDLPQRMGLIERPRDQLPNALLQGRARTEARPSRRGLAHHVAAEIERLVVDPFRAQPALHGLLPKARSLQQTATQAAAQRRVGNRGLQQAQATTGRLTSLSSRSHAVSTRLIGTRSGVIAQLLRGGPAFPA